MADAALDHLKAPVPAALEGGAVLGNHPAGGVGMQAAKHRKAEAAHLAPPGVKAL